MSYGAKKRNKFYELLLFHYLKLNKLTIKNIENVLVSIIHKFDESVNKDDIINIIQEKKMDGVVLKKLIDQQNCDKLMQFFDSLNVTKPNWRKIRDHIKTNWVCCMYVVYIYYT